MSWSDDKELSSEANIIGWNSLKKKVIKNDMSIKKATYNITSNIIKCMASKKKYIYIYIYNKIDENNIYIYIYNRS